MSPKDFGVFDDIFLIVDMQDVFDTYEDYPLDFCDVIKVFEFYFNEYESRVGMRHPKLNLKAMHQILEVLPFIYDSNLDKEIPLLVDDYRQIIKMHFSTEYRFTDYNILHFFSGRIRLLRFYELQNRS